MKRVVYMDGHPIQHPGEIGRELPLKICDMFTPLDAEHIFNSAGKVENYVNNTYRIQSFTESYKELKDIQEAFEISKKSLGSSERYRIERRIRSYFLEADVFFSHWRRFLGNFKKRNGVDIYKDMENQYRDDATYNLLRFLRNHIMHAGDIIHGVHIGVNDSLLWTDADVLKNDIRDKKNRGLIDKCGKKIDLFKLADDSYPLVQAIHGYFMRAVAKHDKRLNLKAECEYLVSMRSRIFLFKATDWLVFSETGIENVEVGLPYIGGVPGIGVDYHRLDWEIYKKLLEWCEDEDKGE